METSDYLIIGAGPGGYELAAAAARQRNKVTLIERRDLGGTCLNRGCIPTKTLAHGAGMLRDARHAALYGVYLPEIAVDYPALCARRDEVVNQLREGVATILAGVKIVNGDARFVGPKTVAVGDETFTADKIVIATGSEPAWLPVEGSHDAISSDTLLTLNEIPSSMAIIGGGVIGMEFASIFSTLGCDVTVIEYCKEVLPQFDKDIAKRLRSQMAADGVKFITSARVTAIRGHEVIYQLGDETASVEAQTVVMAVGRRPVIPEGLAEAGVELTERGAIKVDPATMLTTADGVYAIGDVNALCMLAHAASAQGRVILGEEVDLAVIPSVVFTHPEVAMVGMTEQQLKDAGIAAKSAKGLFRANGKALSMAENEGLVKIIYDPASRAIFGASIIGPHASDLIQELTVAIANKLTINQLAATIHPHPTLSEVILAAAQSAK